MNVKPGSNDTLKYCCPPKQEGGCNGRVIGVKDLSEFIDEYMIGRLNDPMVTEELASREAVADDDTEQLLAAISADERRLAVLQQELEDGDEDDMADVLAAARTVRARIKQRRHDLANRANMPAVVREDLPGLARRWKSLPLETKQELLRVFIRRIEIAPARRGLGKFDPTRVDIVSA